MRKKSHQICEISKNKQRRLTQNKDINSVSNQFSKMNERARKEQRFNTIRIITMKWQELVFIVNNKLECNWSFE